MYPHLQEFLKEYIHESFRQTWGITDSQIADKARELYEALDQNPSQNVEYQGEVDDDYLPEFVLHRTMVKYVSTLVEIQGQLILASDECDMIGEYAIVAYIEDGGRISNWKPYLSNVRSYRLKYIFKKYEKSHDGDPNP